MLASAGGDGKIRLWSVARHRQAGRPMAGHSDAVLGVRFGPDGTMIASGGADWTVRLWDVASRRPIGDPLKGHGGEVYEVAFSPDGRTLACRPNPTSGSLASAE
jgi:WD40 repeat protein